MEKLEFIACQNEKIFDAILSERPSLNFSILKTILRKKDIKVNGKRITQNVEVKNGDKVTIFLPQKNQKKVSVIYEDKNVIIANKPQGIEVTKADKVFLDSECLEEILKATACHRLDKNTEGLVILAKNKITEDVFFDVFKGHKLEKKYKAIVFGNVSKNGEKLQNYIKKEQNFAKICPKIEKNAKIAKLSYKLLEQKNDLFLIDINLETGRFHQIRAQLANKGIFVLGDNKYGKKEMNKKYNKSKQQLCAYKITFQNLPYPLQSLSNKTFEIDPCFSLNEIIEVKNNESKN